MNVIDLVGHELKTDSFSKFCPQNSILPEQQEILENRNQTLYWYLNNLKSIQHLKVSLFEQQYESETIAININSQPHFRKSILFAQFWSAT